jgi:hypothetical protein
MTAVFARGYWRSAGRAILASAFVLTLGACHLSFGRTCADLGVAMALAHAGRLLSSLFVLKRLIDHADTRPA